MSTTPLLVFADEAGSVRLWPYETGAGTALVYGPALLRGATISGTTAQLTGDTIGETGLEVWGPRGLTEVTWNGRAVPSTVTTAGSLRSNPDALLPGVPAVPLPALDGWRRKVENQEAAVAFDDSKWTAANRTSTFSTTAIPAGQPLLFADDYGFHYGDVWYRGRFTTSTTDDLESVTLAYSTGTQGLLMAWLDGEPLGTHRMPVPTTSSVRQGSWAAKATLPVPEKVRTAGSHVLSVLVRRMQHDQDGKALDTHKVARGLTAVTFKGASRR